MSTLQKDRILQLRGEALYDRDGDKIGTVDEIYLDADSGAPEWALVSTGLFGSKSTFVPVSEATESEGGLRVVRDLPAPSHSLGGSDQPLSAGDVLEVDVFQVDNLDRTVQIDASGRISLPGASTLKRRHRFTSSRMLPGQL